MTDAAALQRGRESFARRAWSDAFGALSAADAEAPLDPEDLERLAVAAYLAGRETVSAEVWTRAHQARLARGEVERAARCVFWLAFWLLNQGDLARAGGWVARARRLLGDRPADCAERGFLLWADGYRCIAEGDCAGAAALFERAAEIGERRGEPDLVALARHGGGRALIRLGDARAGVALLDEAMAAVDAGELSPIVVGDVYCSVISGCLEIFDLRRAREWTAALTRWCEAQPGLVPYSGECLVRRAELLLLHGAWTEAAEAAQRACERCLRAPDRSPTGAAFYQRAELHRLRGELGAAEEGYREASRRGRAPQPGLARLRLAQGRVAVAATAIRRALDEAEQPRARATLLPAQVDIMLAAGDVAAARAAANELAAMADRFDAPYVHAVAAHACGAVLLAEGDARGAVPVLRRAWTLWQELDASYEAARVRVLVGRACRALGDEDGAAMELDAARWTFQRLGAGPDLARLAELSAAAQGAPVGLTAREREVLRLVATGRTNRAIAVELRISEKTVARHVSNIFVKLGLSSRAAATAYAYRRGLA